MPLKHLQLPTVQDLESLGNEHGFSLIEICKLACSIILHHFFDIHSYQHVQYEPKSATSPEKAKLSLIEWNGDGTRGLSIIDALKSLSGHSLANGHGNSDRAEPRSSANGDHVSTGAKTVSGPIFVTGLVCAKFSPKELILQETTATMYDLAFLLSKDTQSPSSGRQAALDYDDTVYSEFLVEGVARTFSTLLESILRNPHGPVSAIHMVSSEDHSMVDAWNRESPRAHRRCLHQLVEESAHMYPDKPAIVSWDEDVTYAQLNNMADKLAIHLISTYGLHPVKKKVVVPLCFDKSSWTIVAMLAVLKAGSAYCCLDPAHPKARHDFIIKSLNASLIIVSPGNKHLFQGRYPDNMFLLDKETLDGLEQVDQAPNSGHQHSPDDICMIAFTSGSTGVPKGIVHTHTTVCTGLLENGTREELARPDSRVFQWAAYTFDVSLTEIWMPLIYGGCTCIPSESERLNDVQGAMNRMQCDWAFFTPSFARFFRRFTVPTLKVLAMGGEAIMPDDVNAWVGRVDKVLSVYGPAECVTWLLKDYIEPLKTTKGAVAGSPISFGRPSACNVHAWIVDPDDPELLAPLGAIGELLIEGPAILIEYLHDAAKTDAFLIQPPPWRTSVGALRGPDNNGRIYKTGDLVRYVNAAGEMTYVGRKDATVKLRGQRIDLGEIESVLRVALGDLAQEVAVDVIVPAGRSRDDQTLVAFIRVADGTVAPSNPGGWFPDSSVQNALRNNLPEYMVPRIFYRVESFPYNASRKLDRRALREFASALTLDQLSQQQQSAHAVSPPLTLRSSKLNGYRNDDLTPVESQFRSLVANILGMEPHSIKPEDNFFALGGSSLSVLRLVAAARDHGLHVTYTDIFKSPCIEQMAEKAKRFNTKTPVVNGSSGIPISNSNVAVHVDDNDGHVEPFSLLPSEDRDGITRDAMSQCHVEKSEIQDILPITRQQEGLWALSLASSSGTSYVAHFQMRLREHIDVARFRRAWERAANSVAFMRTRFVQSVAGASYQVVLKTAPTWKESVGDDVEEYVKADLREEPLDFGRALTRYAFMSGEDNRVMIWTSHHALYDGHSIPLFLNLVAKLYRGERFGPEVPFNRFIRHVVNDISDDKETVYKHYWLSRYNNKKGSPKATNFPKIPFPTYRPHSTGELARSISYSQPENLAITSANVVRAALAMTLSQMTHAQTVNYLETLDGRSVPVTQVESIIGPTFATVPRNTTINNQATIEEFLFETQTTSADMVLYAQYGLQSIRNLSPECAEACEFQTILVIEPEYLREYEDVLEFDEGGGGIQRFNSDCLMWKCNLTESGVDLIASFDGHVISEESVGNMVDLFDKNVQFLCNQDRSLPLSTRPAFALDDIDNVVVQTPTAVNTSRNGVTEPPNGRDHGNNQSKSNLAVLTKAWIETLGAAEAESCADHDFFLKGGNSIRAMELVATARRMGVSISVADVFRNPVLHDLATVATSLPTSVAANQSGADIAAPFGLLGPQERRDAIMNEASLQCGLPLSEIEDIVPSTPLQAEFMASSQQKTGAWMAQVQYPIPPCVSVETFKAFWERLHRHFNMLRSRLVHCSSYGGAFVVVVSRSPASRITWAESYNDTDYLIIDRKTPMEYGDSLTRYAIVQGAEGIRKMVLSIHHSVYDGFTLDKLHQALHQLLRGNTNKTLGTTPSSVPFIQHCMPVDRQAERQFWVEYLAGYAPKSPFPNVRGAEPSADMTRKIPITLPSYRRWPNITLPIMMFAAWAMVIGKHANEDDIVFGTRLSGRGVPVPDIMDMADIPTIAHVPVRVRLPTCTWRKSEDMELDPIDMGKIATFLHKLQQDQSDVMAYQQTGLRSLAMLDESGAGRAACAFQNMIIIQRPTESLMSEVENELGLCENIDDYKYFNDRALLVDVFPSVSGERADVVFSYDSSILAHDKVDELARDFEECIFALNDATGYRRIVDE